ncbi:thiol peroxidase [Fusibacter tunisiensis]|uniref:Thiol peroxidase n=1 Tax=Fusibacter tunisiensis TaxID=1008308 RepID=A0ABS2MRR1_9FIRM|nr:thiol peroxidase [Fusibacter tunisiensis]MBM7562055.1 thiol peroxidase [Fusibacter tunisiensis]
MNTQVTFGGSPVTLEGNTIKVGDQAPNFKAVNKDLSPFDFSSLGKKIKIISVVPSVDTRICEFQTIRFNEEATKRPDVVVLTISVDLPFAQKRFCVANSIENAIVVSDYKDLDFGQKYGFIMKEHRLLARGILIIDAEDTVRYVEYVPEVGSHPDYDAALQFLETL